MPITKQRFAMDFMLLVLSICLSVRWYDWSSGFFFGIMLTHFSIQLGHTVAT